MLKVVKETTFTLRLVHFFSKISFLVTDMFTSIFQCERMFFNKDVCKYTITYIEIAKYHVIIIMLTIINSNTVFPLISAGSQLSAAPLGIHSEIIGAL